MPVKLLYHDTAHNGGVSPFDAALLQITQKGKIRLACPYIGLGYLRRVIGQRDSWFLLTDIEEWLRSQDHTQRLGVYKFLVENRDRIRHYPRLHAKVAIGPQSAMVGSANLTDAGIRQRIEVSVLFKREPQVQELADWFDAHWISAYEMDESRLARIAAFIAKLPKKGVVDQTPPTEIDPLISMNLASLAKVSATAQTSYNGASNGEFYFNFGHEAGWRDWEDARRYGFICAGGGSWFSAPMAKLGPGHRVWIYAPHYGYVGVARVTGTVQPASRFQVRSLKGKMLPVMDVVASSDGYHIDDIDDPERCEYFVSVRWLQTVPVEEAVTEQGFFATELIVCQPSAQKWHDTFKRLKKAFPNYDS